MVGSPPQTTTPLQTRKGEAHFRVEARCDEGRWADCPLSPPESTRSPAPLRSQMLALNLALVVSALAAPALAHFTLDYPPTRGFDEDIEPEVSTRPLLCVVPQVGPDHACASIPSSLAGLLVLQFCGGFPDVSAVRTPFPLSNGSLSIDSHHTKATCACRFVRSPSKGARADHQSSPAQSRSSSPSRATRPATATSRTARRSAALLSPHDRPAR